MAEVSQRSRESSNPASTLHHTRSLPFNAIRQFSASLKSVHAAVQGIAGLQITGERYSHLTALSFPLAWPSLNAGKRLADVEAESRVKRERAIVVRGLHQSHTRGMTLPG